MILDKGPVPGKAGAKIVNVADAGTGTDHVLDPSPVLARQLPVEKLSERLDSDGPRVPQHVARDEESERGIDAVPPGPARDGQRRQDRRIQGDVAEVMRPILADRG